MGLLSPREMNRKKAAGIALFFAFLLVLAGLGGWWVWREMAPEVMPPEKFVLKPATFNDLPGWKSDDFTRFPEAFFKSCDKLMTLPADRRMGDGGWAGTAGDWQPLCEAARNLTADAADWRAFFESHFTPFSVLNNDRAIGLFTGYYEASLKGSRDRKPPYLTPLYLRPPELVMVELGRFREELKGHRIAGRVEDGMLVPYASRAEIDQGALSGRDLEFVWVDSPVDAFFLHIQGSGVIEMEDGSELRVGYAAQNGHPYFAIGRELIDQGHIAREEMSMQAIRNWLEANPDKAEALMQKNPSFVFFRELNTGGPIGAQGVELTPERSLAVDRKYWPLGVPVWLSTQAAPASSPQEVEKFERLMMAQDTGGAIRGPVRGDVFWGHGDYAYDMSGGMKSEGRLWILLPKALAAAVIPSS